MPFVHEQSNKDVKLTKGIQSFVHVDLVGKRMSQGQGGKEHLDANDEVLVSSCNGSLADRNLRRADLRNRTTFLQDGQQHACKTSEITVYH